MKGIITKIENENRAWVNFKYIGVYPMYKKPSDLLSVGDTVYTSDFKGLENHDQYVQFIKKT